MRVDLVNVPSPHDFERRSDYLERLASHPTMTRLYPPPIKRRLAGERRWIKAKNESLVSVSTSAGEVLLFGSL